MFYKKNPGIPSQKLHYRKNENINAYQPVNNADVLISEGLSDDVIHMLRIKIVYEQCNSGFLFSSISYGARKTPLVFCKVNKLT